MKKILVGVVAAVMSASVFAATDKATQARIDALELEMEMRIIKLEKQYQTLIDEIEYKTQIQIEEALKESKKQIESLKWDINSVDSQLRTLNWSLATGTYRR